jgi:hypothetical protein
VKTISTQAFLSCKFPCIHWDPSIKRTIGKSSLPTHITCGKFIIIIIVIIIIITIIIFLLFYIIIKLVEPTAQPTLIPTRYPTNSPTFRPTNVPTKIPTAVPTPIPTISPTYKPTPIPLAGVPTPIPTNPKPTFEPTFIPTNNPTLRPINKPTDAPTFTPTAPPIVTIEISQNFQGIDANTFDGTTKTSFINAVALTLGCDPTSIIIVSVSPTTRRKSRILYYNANNKLTLQSSGATIVYTVTILIPNGQSASSTYNQALSVMSSPSVLSNNLISQGLTAITVLPATVVNISPKIGRAHV